MICDNLSSAVMFYKGKNLPVVMSVEVSDVSVFSEEKTKVEVEKPVVSEYKITYSKADIIDSGKCGDNAEWNGFGTSLTVFGQSENTGRLEIRSADYHAIWVHNYTQSGGNVEAYSTNPNVYVYGIGKY